MLLPNATALNKPFGDGSPTTQSTTQETLPFVTAEDQEAVSIGSPQDPQSSNMALAQPRNELQHPSDFFSKSSQAQAQVQQLQRPVLHQKRLSLSQQRPPQYPQQQLPPCLQPSLQHPQLSPQPHPQSSILRQSLTHFDLRSSVLTEESLVHSLKTPSSSTSCPTSSKKTDKALTPGADECLLPKSFEARSKHSSWKSKGEERYIVDWWTNPTNYQKYKNPQHQRFSATKAHIYKALAVELNNCCVGDTEIGTLEEVVIKKCWFYCLVDNVWSGDMSNDPITLQSLLRSERKIHDDLPTEDDDVQDENIDGDGGYVSDANYDDRDLEHESTQPVAAIASSGLPGAGERERGPVNELLGTSTALRTSTSGIQGMRPSKTTRSSELVSRTSTRTPRLKKEVFFLLLCFDLYKNSR
ncbi:hypothetical protein EDD21DRAFT_446193 [Dissophora ornata]|nr:hypothetical protein EDD21DRAFT_446193 [Dissophora ornata]